MFFGFCWRALDERPGYTMAAAVMAISKFFLLTDTPTPVVSARIDLRTPAAFPCLPAYASTHLLECALCLVRRVQADNPLLEAVGS